MAPYFSAHFLSPCERRNNSGCLTKEGVALWHAGFGGKEGQTGADGGSRITNYHGLGIHHSLPYEGVGRFKKVWAASENIN